MMMNIDLPQPQIRSEDIQFRPVLHNGSAYMMGGDLLGISDLIGIGLTRMQPENRYAALGLGLAAILLTRGQAADEVLKAEAAAAKAESYAGVKAASKYLQEAGVPRSYRVEIIKSFQIETISLKTANNATFGLRFYGGKANEFGRYLFPTFSNTTTRAGLALPPSWGNSMKGISQFQIAPGTPYIFGRAASQGGIYTGGNYQMYINNVANLIK